MSPAPVEQVALQGATGEGRSAGAKRARRLIVALMVVVGAFALDVQQPPANQISARILVGAIDVYQATLSRVLAASGANCRFEPTCSHYGRAVIDHYGTITGVIKTTRRVVSCNPWTPDGTIDLPYPGWSPTRLAVPDEAADLD